MPFNPSLPEEQNLAGAVDCIDIKQKQDNRLLSLVNDFTVKYGHCHPGVFER